MIRAEFGGNAGRSIALAKNNKSHVDLSILVPVFFKGFQNIHDFVHEIFQKSVLINFCFVRRAQRENFDNSWFIIQFRKVNPINFDEIFMYCSNF